MKLKDLVYFDHWLKLTAQARVVERLGGAGWAAGSWSPHFVYCVVHYIAALAVVAAEEVVVFAESGSAASNLAGSGPNKLRVVAGLVREAEALKVSFSIFKTILNTFEHFF